MNEIKNIAKCSRIAIYGAGEVGLLVKHYIENNRPDLRLVCFFDKTERADIEGLPVCLTKKIKELKETFDLVIVASYSNIAIMETVLRHYGVSNYMHLEDFYLNRPEENSECVKIEDETRIEQVKEILFSEESKNLFGLITAAHWCRHCLGGLSEYIREQNKLVYPQIHEQYLDFIDKDSIKTVISAGAYDGGTSLLFLDRLKNVEKIWAFEPMYEKFKCEVNDGIIAESGKVEVIQKGVFDKSCQIGFLECSNASAININGCEGQIQTVSIDEFVEEKGIKKVDFIKMDIEGCELAALKGAKKTIEIHRPQLAICIYHSWSELFDIPLYLDSVLTGYKFEVYHYSLNNIWESVLYAIPAEVNSK